MKFSESVNLCTFDGFGLNHTLILNNSQKGPVRSSGPMSYSNQEALTVLLLKVWCLDHSINTTWELLEMQTLGSHHQSTHLIQESEF